MNSDIRINLQETYLYKLHILSNELDKVFSDALTDGANLTLSQFLLLAIISDYSHINQRQIAGKLSISPAAINRQTEIAVQEGLVNRRESKISGTDLQLTEAGRKKLAESLRVLEGRVFGIFDGSSGQADLMVHIDGILNEIRKEQGMSTSIPSAKKLFKGDINTAVIAVQKLTGVEITPEWWDKNVGNTGSAGEILNRFDLAYARDYGKQISSKN